MITWILSWMLHNANRNPGFCCRERFYSIKDRMLKKHGTLIGYDRQHIKKECYSCDSSGVFKCNWRLPEACWNCMGTGIYTEFWVLLAVYQFGSYEFHIPIERTYSAKHWISDPDNKAIRNYISGYINHKAPRFRSECLLWLYLIYDFKTFKKIFGHIGYSRGYWPMVFLFNTAFKLRNLRLNPIKWWSKGQWKVDYWGGEIPF